MTYAFRFVLKWARWVHVYVTMFGFLLVLFFAVTGFILNHPSWFELDEEPIQRVETGTLPTRILAEPDKLAVVEALRKHFGASGAVDSFTFDKEDEAEPIDVRFKAPGRITEAKIDRKDGQTTVKHSLYGVLGLLTDLHRGEGSGKMTGDAWAVVIDSVAVMLVVMSVTGLILWTSLRSRGQHGLALMSLAVAICVVVYFLFVP